MANEAKNMLEGVKKWFRFPLPCAGGKLCEKLREFVRRACAPREEYEEMNRLSERLSRKAQAYDVMVAGKHIRGAGTLSDDSPVEPLEDGIPMPIAAGILLNATYDALEYVEDCLDTKSVQEALAYDCISTVRERLKDALIACNLYRQYEERRARNKKA
jgi:hypothetical protein